MNLTSGGYPLSTAPDKFGYLRESQLGDPEELRARFEEDGYLYIRGFFDREEVRAVRMSILQVLADEGLLDPNEPMERGIVKPGLEMYFRPDIANANEAMKALIYSPRVLGFYEGLLGGPIRHYDYTWMRAIAPGKGTSPHMDIVYMGRGTQNLRTLWVPYGDVPLAVGGLMILENSHRYVPLQETYAKTDVDRVCENLGNQIEPLARGYHGFGALTDNPLAIQDEIGGRWLTSPEYRMGDLLTFGMHTVHGSLDNGSREIRLSSDSRYQLASDPVDERWVGEAPIGHGERARVGMIC